MVLARSLSLRLLCRHWLARHLKYRCSVRSMVGWCITGTSRLAVKLSNKQGRRVVVTTIVRSLGHCFRDEWPPMIHYQREQDCEMNGHDLSMLTFVREGELLTSSMRLRKRVKGRYGTGTRQPNASWATLTRLRDGLATGNSMN